MHMAFWKVFFAGTPIVLIYFCFKNIWKLSTIYIIKYIDSTPTFKKNVTTSTSLNRSHFVTTRRRYIQNYTFGVPVAKITILLCYY